MPLVLVVGAQLSKQGGIGPAEAMAVTDLLCHPWTCHLSGLSSAGPQDLPVSVIPQTLQEPLSLQ